MIDNIKFLLESPEAKSFVAQYILTKSFDMLGNNIKKGLRKESFEYQLKKALDKTLENLCNDFELNFKKVATDYYNGILQINTEASFTTILKESLKEAMDTEITDQMLERFDDHFFVEVAHDDYDILRRVIDLSNDDIIIRGLKSIEEMTCKLVLNEDNYTLEDRTPINHNHLYEEAYCEYLFLENSSIGGKARLQDVYVIPDFNTKLGNFVNLFSFVRQFVNSDEICSEYFYDQVNFKRQKTLFIFGAPGSGKSSFVSYLVCNKEKLTDNAINVIRLRELSEEQINKNMEGILEFMNIDEKSLNSSIIILEGLDEICALYHGNNFYDYLSNIIDSIRKLDSVKLLITSRHGYLNFEKYNKQIDKFSIFVDIATWSDKNIQDWGKFYSSIHSDIANTISDNVGHLMNPENKYKKDIFAIPITFYMANAKNILIKDYDTICSLYDAVFEDIIETRRYDPIVQNQLHKIISPKLSRQIAREIAFKMFTTGKLIYSMQDDPMLYPDDVSNAINLALLNSNSIDTITEVNKKKIKELYGLTFFYKGNRSNINAVEFAHKSIAEYFTAEKIIGKLEEINKLENNSHDFYRKVSTILNESFGQKPITNEILLYLREKLKLNLELVKSLNESLSSCFRRIVVSGELFYCDDNIKFQMHPVDRIQVILKSTLVLLDILDYNDYLQEVNLSSGFNDIIANIFRMSSISVENNIDIPVYLNGFSLENGDFSNTKMNEARLCGAILNEANFESSFLIDAHLNQSVIDGACFNNADLSGADLFDLTCENIQCINTRLNEANLSNSVFIKSDFRDSSFYGAICIKCKFKNSTDLTGALFNGTRLDYADISGADISETQWWDSEADDECLKIPGLLLTQEQYEYLKEISTVRLIDYKIVDLE